MSERPEPPPEARLIAATLKRAHMSVREAARRAGISEGRWRQIMNGYQTVSAGVHIPVIGPAETVARMAQVAKVRPDQLGNAGREDAAFELQNMIEAEPPAERWTEAGGGYDGPFDPEFDATLERIKRDPARKERLRQIIVAAQLDPENDVESQTGGERGKDTG